MKAKWNILAILVLLATLVGASASPAAAQETHYFTWTPNPPEEGGAATFTAHYPEAYTFIALKSSLSPGEACDYQWGSAFYPDDVSAIVDFEAPGDYLFCLDIWLDGGAHVYDYQTVSVKNMPPWLDFPSGSIQPEPSMAGEEIVYPTAYGLDYDPMETWVDWTCDVDYGDGTGVQPAVWEYPINNYNTCVGPNHVFTTAGTYTITFRIYEPGVAEPGIGTVQHVVEPAPPPAPYVSDISITSKTGRKNTSTYTGLVTVLGESGPLNKASVTAQWMRIASDGTKTSVATQKATTNRTGVAKFTLSSTTANYDLCVTNVVAKGFTWPTDQVVCYTDIHQP